MNLSSKEVKNVKQTKQSTFPCRHAGESWHLVRNEFHIHGPLLSPA